MFGNGLRKKCSKTLDKVGLAFAWTHVPPNVFSSLALLLAAGGALLFHLHHHILAFVLIGLACLWDTIDGGVARAQKRVTKFGYYLEGIIDKWVEVIIYLGFAVSGYALEAFLVISASLLLSFAKPRAAMVVPLGEHDWPAIGERFERLLLLNVGLARRALLADRPHRSPRRPDAGDLPQAPVRHGPRRRHPADPLRQEDHRARRPRQDERPDAERLQP